MTKRTHKYHLTLEQLCVRKEEIPLQPPLHLDFENHDEIFRIIEILKEKDPFGDKNEAVEFALGLKLFTEVMIRNRKHPLFEEFSPALALFMKKLKSS